MSNDQNIRRLPKYATSRSIPNEVKAVIGKLAADPNGAASPRSNIRLPDNRVMSHVANQTIGSIQDARNLFQVLPDLGLARQILISATISPGDLTDSKLIYSVNDTSLDSSLTGPLLRNTQEFFDNSYRIRSLLHPILNDVMFETGSYPILIMPESSIDQIINGDGRSNASMESIVSLLDSHISAETDDQGNYLPWGILGNGNISPSDTFDSYTGVSFESMQTDKYVSSVNVSTFKVSFESLASGVNGKDESVKKFKATLESLGRDATKMISDVGSTINVTDNMNILKRPMVVETRRKYAIRRIYGGRLHARTSLESAAQNGDENSRRTLKSIEKSLYNRRTYKHIPVQPILTRDQVGAETYGHPMVIHLPSESVIPIHVPGNAAEHIGYYVMLDIDGNPIQVADQQSYMDDIRNQMNTSDSYSSQIIQQARRGFEGMGGMQNEIISEMSRIHGEAVESDLLNRLRSGVLSGNYELGRTDHVDRLMLSRHLKGQRTTMLFVPAELMVYFAFDYNEYGVGKSMLEDAKILGSLSSAVMLANTLATINNAVGGKTINIELDPEDEDPVGTVEFLLSENAKVNSQGFGRIVGSTHPMGLADQIQNHGVNVAVTGNSRYPETKFDVSSRDGTSRQIDTEYEKSQRDRLIQVFGLTPEMIDGSNQTDFATTVVQNNLMLLKRVIQNQDKFDPFMTDFVRRYMANSGLFIDEMRKIINDNKDHLPEDIARNAAMSEAEKIDEFMYRFIDSVNVNLPSPEVGDIKKSMEQFDAYTEALDKIIDARLNEEMFAADTTIGMEELIPNIKVMIRSEFQRRWLRKYNVMPELDIFDTIEEDGTDVPAFDLLENTVDHIDGINRSISGYVKKVLEAAKVRAGGLKDINEAKAELNKIKDEAGSESMDSGSSFDDTSNTTEGDGLDEDLDLNLDSPEDGLNLDSDQEGSVEEEEEVLDPDPAEDADAGNENPEQTS